MIQLTQRQSTQIFAYLLLLPALGFLTFIVLIPLAEAIRLSFTNTGLSANWKYVGFYNYTRIFKKGFDETILLTFFWMFMSVGLKLIIGTMGALLLNAQLWGKTMFRILTIPPWIIPIAIGIMGWAWMYNGNFGLVSNVMQFFGILDGPYEFLGYPKSALWACIVTDVWVGIPMVTIFLLAAMQGIPRDLYEAAWCDGASRWRRFWRITLPGVSSTMATISILSAIWTFNSFEIIWILTKGGPRGATTTMIIDTYKVAIGRFKYGEGSARAVIIVLILSIFITFYFLLLRYLQKRKTEGKMFNA